MIPRFDDHGRLPLGEHTATTWEEIVERFGWNPHVAGSSMAFPTGCALAAAGCRQVWLDGSFVTSKDEPADFDACWDLEDVDLDRLDPVLLNLSAGRRAQKARCGGEFFPNVVEAGSGLVFADFFQNDRDTGRKGIVVIHPEEELL